MSEKTHGANRSIILRRALLTAAVLLVAALFMAPVAADENPTVNIISSTYSSSITFDTPYWWSEDGKTLRLNVTYAAGLTNPMASISGTYVDGSETKSFRMVAQECFLENGEKHIATAPDITVERWNENLIVADCTVYSYTFTKIPSSVEISVDGLTYWDYNGDTKTLTISGSGSMPDFFVKTGSEAIEGHPSMAGGGSRLAAFPWHEQQLNIDKISIEHGVSSIGAHAFRSVTVTSVSIPASVQSIANNAFYQCCNLPGITISSSVTSIGNDAFNGCTTLTNLVISESSTPLSIGARAFSGCTSLTSLTLPKSVLSTGDASFNGCTSLTSITFSDSLTRIGESAFQGCTSLTSVTIPKSVTHIGSSAFSGCTSLTSVTIIESSTEQTIDGTAFNGCTALTHVILPKSVKTINGGAFHESSNVAFIMSSGIELTTILTDQNHSYTFGEKPVFYFENTEDMNTFKNSFPTYAKRIASTNGGTFSTDYTFVKEQFAEPKKVGYDFVDWFKEDDTEAPDSIEAGTYYAKWTVKAPSKVTVAADKTSITPEETATLTATPDKPEPSEEGVEYTYQWFAGETKVSESTETNTYKVTNLDADTTYTCVIVASKGTDSVTVTSDEVTIKKAAQKGTITISGKQTDVTYGGSNSFTFTYETNIVGKTLTVASSNTEVATVSGTGSPVTVTILGVGETEISVRFVGDNEFSSAKDNFTMKVSVGTRTMTIKPVVDVETFIGGGMVNLTVDGAPNEGFVTVTHNGVVLPKNADGTYSATLPNEDGQYSFKATYSGDNYQVPEATYTVTVKKLDAEVVGVANGMLKPQVISAANETALNTAIAGDFKDKFEGKTTIVYLDVSLLIDGIANHEKEVTFIIGYESLNIDPSKWAEYEFVVLHLDNGTPEIVKAEAKAGGLQITSKCSPFAIGYNVKKTDDDNDGGGSSTPQGSVVWLTETPTPTPTETATPTETVPTSQPTATQTEAESPLSVLAVLGGLGAVAILRRR